MKTNGVMIAISMWTLKRSRTTLSKIKKAKHMSNSIKQISTERLIQIEQERYITQGDKQFQKWCKDLRIGIMYRDKQGIDNANRMMAQWPEFMKRMYS
jgi:hypothetical protein